MTFQQNVDKVFQEVNLNHDLYSKSEVKALLEMIQLRLTDYEAPVNLDQLQDEIVNIVEGMDESNVSLSLDDNRNRIGIDLDTNDAVRKIKDAFRHYNE